MSVQILSEAEKKSLLKVARATIERCVGLAVPGTSVTEAPTFPAGAFVSLHRNGELRGCIGTFEMSSPVVHAVREMAQAASTRDTRFKPVSAEEMSGLNIEISVLTPSRKITDVSEIEIGVHGLIISNGYRRGVLLPQVATEYRWDRETFLAQTCTKAGIPRDAWKQPSTSIEVFTAQVFGEKDYSSSAD